MENADIQSKINPPTTATTPPRKEMQTGNGPGITAPEASTGAEKHSPEAIPTAQVSEIPASNAFKPDTKASTDAAKVVPLISWTPLSPTSALQLGGEIKSSHKPAATHPDTSTRAEMIAPTATSSIQKYKEPASKAVVSDAVASTKAAKIDPLTHWPSQTSREPTTSTTRPAYHTPGTGDTFFFGYSYDLDPSYMRTARNPALSGTFVGLGALPDYKWQIGTDGYPTVSSSKKDHVYGMVYSLSPDDVKALDDQELHLKIYDKKFREVKMIGEGADVYPLMEKGRDVFAGDGEVVRALVYVGKNDKVGVMEKSNAPCLIKGLHYAMSKGMPIDYVDACLQKMYGTPVQPLGSASSNSG